VDIDIYVGNLPHEMTEDKLRDEFATFVTTLTSQPSTVSITEGLSMCRAKRLGWACQFGGIVSAFTSISRHFVAIVLQCSLRF